MHDFTSYPQTMFETNCFNLYLQIHVVLGMREQSWRPSDSCKLKSLSCIQIVYTKFELTQANYLGSPAN